MGQKIHPFGFRVGISKDWKSRWIGDKKEVPLMVIEDYRIRKFLTDKLSTAGLRDVEIERSVNSIGITVCVSKPGLVIGKGGSGVENLEKQLRTFTKSKIKLSAVEVKVPETEAQLVADYIYRQLKRRVPYRRAINFALDGALEKGAKGIKIKMSGLLSGGNSIGRTETFKKGPIPTQTLRADIDYAQLDAHLIFGIIGIKVWVYKGELDI